MSSLFIKLLIQLNVQSLSFSLTMTLRLRILIINYLDLIISLIKMS